jgi:hypothetical protein
MSASYGNRMVESNSNNLREAVIADVSLRSSACDCWTRQMKNAAGDLQMAPLLNVSVTLQEVCTP